MTIFYITHDVNACLWKNQCHSEADMFIWEDDWYILNGLRDILKTCALGLTDLWVSQTQHECQRLNKI